MLCPTWIDTRIQPITVRDVLAYLVGYLLNPETAGKRFDIGVPEILTYREMMDHMRMQGENYPKDHIRVPVLTSLLAA